MFAWCDPAQYTPTPRSSTQSTYSCAYDCLLSRRTPLCLRAAIAKVRNPANVCTPFAKPYLPAALDPVSKLVLCLASASVMDNDASAS